MYGDRVFLDQSFVARQIQPGIGQQGFVALQIPFHLLQSRFVGTRVDLRQRVALVYGLTLGEQDLLHDPADLGSDGHRGQGCDRAQSGDAQLDIARAAVATDTATGPF